VTGSMPNLEVDGASGTVQVDMALRTDVRWRLGVATRVLGAPIKSHDSRRWAQAPHLSVSLAYVRDILGWLAEQQISLYRLSGSLAPYATHPTLRDFHRQVEECQRELAAAGDLARAAGIRMTMHPAAFVRLDADDEALARRSREELIFATTLLEAMGTEKESVIVVHANEGENLGEGGAPWFQSGGGHRASLRRDHSTKALARFARSIDALPASVRDRLVLENGDRACDLPAALWLQRRTGLPVVFDVLHHRCNNSAGIPIDHALQMALVTWPKSVRPKIHLSSPRTEMRLVRRGGALHAAAPLPRQHSDYVNVFECIDLLRSAEVMNMRDFDIMLEAKAHDLAVLRLRTQLSEFTPDLAGRVR
jgi:UV DNA damage endonuclease